MERLRNLVLLVMVVMKGWEKMVDEGATLAGHCVREYLFPWGKADPQGDDHHELETHGERRLCLLA